jgi:hypothetical protein
MRKRFKVGSFVTKLGLRGGDHERASATTFAGPGTYLRSKVNSEIAAR